MQLFVPFPDGAAVLLVPPMVPRACRSVCCTARQLVSRLLHGTALCGRYIGNSCKDRKNLNFGEELDWLLKPQKQFSKPLSLSCLQNSFH